MPYSLWRVHSSHSCVCCVLLKEICRHRKPPCEITRSTCSNYKKDLGANPQHFGIGWELNKTGLQFPHVLDILQAGVTYTLMLWKLTFFSAKQSMKLNSCKWNIKYRFVLWHSYKPSEQWQNYCWWGFPPKTLHHLIH